ncbi:MAG: Glucokinase [Firmicutes bacterium ADurb.Bin506]|nr:MAG: Glucokinase [Firmicutes bacterium ADurb.Bin506]
MYYIGIDLGGTKIASMLINSEYEVLARLTVPTRHEEGEQSVIGRITGSAQHLCDSASVEMRQVGRVCVGSPGPIIRQSGMVLDAPNLGWKNVALAPLVSNALGVPVIVENDANAAAVAENLLGAGKASRNMMYITVSTGVGGGLVLDRRLYRGSGGAAGEIGHTTVLPNGPLCGCGNRGCLEALASGTAIARRGQEIAHRPAGRGIAQLAVDGPVTAMTVAEAARRGDRAATAILRDAFEYLGIAVANAANLLNLDTVVIGGGVAGIGDMLFDSVRYEVRARTFAFVAEQCKIVPASLGADSGALGAACCAAGACA